MEPAKSNSLAGLCERCRHGNQVTPPEINRLGAGKSLSITVGQHQVAPAPAKSIVSPGAMVTSKRYRIGRAKTRVM
jgi:hypothetical protein